MTHSKAILPEMETKEVTMSPRDVGNRPMGFGLKLSLIIINKRLLCLLARGLLIVLLD